MVHVVQPGRTDVHVNKPLTNISVAFFQAQTNFIASQVFPNVPVTKSSDVYFQIPRGEFNRNEMKLRGRGGAPASRTHRVTRDSYNCDSWALGEFLSDEDAIDADDPLDLEQQITEGLTQQAMINREEQWASAYFTTGLWGTDYAGLATGAPGASQFASWNRSDSTPVEDVEFMVDTIQESTGFQANTLAIGYPVFRALKSNANILARHNRGQTTGFATNTLDMLRAAFDVENVFVSRAIQNTANEGATDSHSYLLGKNALLCYVPPTPGLRTPSAGYTMNWTAYGPNGMSMRQVRAERNRAEEYIIEDAFDQKLVAADLGFFIENIVP